MIKHPVPQPSQRRILSPQMLHQIITDKITADDDEGFIEVVRQVKTIPGVHVEEEHAETNEPASEIPMMDTAQNEFNRRLHFL